MQIELPPLDDELLLEDEVLDDDDELDELLDDDDELLLDELEDPAPLDELDDDELDELVDVTRRSHVFALHQSSMSQGQSLRQEQPSVPGMQVAVVVADVELVAAEPPLPPPPAAPTAGAVDVALAVPTLPPPAAEVALATVVVVALTVAWPEPPPPPTANSPPHAPSSPQTSTANHTRRIIRPPCGVAYASSIPGNASALEVKATIV